MQNLQQNRTPKVVYLGIPFDQNIHYQTVQSVYQYSVDPQRQAHGAVLDPVPCSVLPHAFNELWARCLNNEGAIPPGLHYSYFCMLHADVVPLTKHWLDVLIDELEESGGDIIHACVVLKSDAGTLSTSVGTLGDPWGLHRKATLSELRWMKEPTFDLEGLLSAWQEPDRGFDGRPKCLCPNTGCMVIKLGPWCGEFPGFQILSRVRVVDGKVRAEFVPEDWLLGHWAAEMGLRVLGTTKVKTSHVGLRPHVTGGADGSLACWGSESVDRAYFGVTESTMS